MEEKWGELWERLISWGWMVWYSHRFIWNRLSRTLLLLNKHTRTHTRTHSATICRQTRTCAHKDAHVHRARAESSENRSTLIYVSQDENIVWGDKRWKSADCQGHSYGFLFFPQIWLNESIGGNNYFLQSKHYKWCGVAERSAFSRALSLMSCKNVFL